MKFHPSIEQMIMRYNEAPAKIDILREILQQSALMGLYRHRFFEHAVFYGGTALRILYGLDRYSEDLDFSLVGSNESFDFTPFVEGMRNEMAALGFDLETSIKEKKNDSGIWSAFLKSNTLSLMLAAKDRAAVSGIHPEQKIQIKLEIDTDPPHVHLPFVSKLILQPVPFYVATYAREDLFAGKLHAALCRSWKHRVKGRDWYDVLWYLQQGVEVYIPHLQERMIQTKHLSPDEPFGKNELMARLHEKIDTIDWEGAKKDVEPFIADKGKIALWSRQLFHDAMAMLRVMSS